MGPEEGAPKVGKVAGILRRINLDKQENDRGVRDKGT